MEEEAFSQEACFSMWAPPLSSLDCDYSEVLVGGPEVGSAPGVDKILSVLSFTLSISENQDFASSPSAWEKREHVHTGQEPSEKLSDGLKADLCQMTGDEAQHKQNLCLAFELSKNCQADYDT